MDFAQAESCFDFMKKACMPGSDMMMDGDHHEISSGRGFCRVFFPMEKKKEKPDFDGDGIPDDEDDGVPDKEDAFPKDKKEHKDTDGDGLGNNADKDDDGDGF